MAVINKENHYDVAKELARLPASVNSKMYRYKLVNDPGQGTRTNERFSLRED